MGEPSPEDESKAKVLEEYRRLESVKHDYGWSLDIEDKGDYYIIYALLQSSKNHSKKLLVKLKCDDYPRQAPLLEFVDPQALEDQKLRNDARSEFYPNGRGIAIDAARSPMPIVCLPGHRIFHANGWHTAWTTPPPEAWRIYLLVERLQTGLNDDWS